MKSVTLHPISMAAGAALLALALFAMSAFGPALYSSARPMKVVGIPDPRDMVVIRQGSPYALPQGRLFVLTGLGLSSVPVGTSGCAVVADGVSGPSFSSSSVNDGGWRSPVNDSTSSVVTAPSWVVRGPATIEVFGPTGATTGRAWGYVTSADPGRTSELRRLEVPLNITGVFDPRDAVAFGLGSHTIPPGKLFVVQSVNGPLLVDGIQEVNGGQYRVLPPGLTVRGGSVIDGAASGFLIDEKPHAFFLDESPQAGEAP